MGFTCQAIMINLITRILKIERQDMLMCLQSNQEIMVEMSKITVNIYLAVSLKKIHKIVLFSFIAKFIITFGNVSVLMNNDIVVASRLDNL